MDSDEDELPIPQGAADMSAFAHLLSSQPRGQVAPLEDERQEGNLRGGAGRTHAASAAPSFTEPSFTGPSFTEPSFSGRARVTSGARALSARGRGRGEKAAETAQRAANDQFKQAFQGMGNAHLNGTQQVPVSTPGRLHTAGGCMGISPGSCPVFPQKPRRLPPGSIPPGERMPSDSSVEVEEFTGLRLKSRRMAADDVKQHIVDARFHKLQSLRSLVVGGQVSEKWATGGILVKKGPTRESTDGKPHAPWKLSTLSKEGGGANLLVLGTAFTEHCKEVEGTVFIVIGAQASAGTLGYSSDPYLKVFSAHQLLPVGSSQDFGICKGINADSKASCTTVINKSMGDYCVEHVGEIYDKYKTQRTEVGGGQFSTTVFLHKAKKIRRCKNLLVKEEPKQQRPAARVTTDQMKDMLKKKDAMTSRACSQGKRFLMLASGLTPASQPSGQLPRAAAVAFGKRPCTLNENKRVSPPEPPKAEQKRPARPKET